MSNRIPEMLIQLYNRRWITTRDGNISFKRAGMDHFLITPSGVVKYDVKVEDLVSISLTDAEITTSGFGIPDAKPSGELHMHRLLQQAFPGQLAVIHAHPTHVVGAMFAGWDLRKLADMFPELYRHTSVAPNVPVLPATSDVLGVATYTALMGRERYDIVGLDRHGVTAVAETLELAFEHIERLDHICEMALKSGVKP